MSTINYKCPSCGGAIGFDGRSQKMLCSYCGFSADPRDFLHPDEQNAGEREAARQEPYGAQWDLPREQWEEGETGEMQVHHCNSCGAEIVGDETLAAANCLYCGNPVVIGSQVSGTLKPDLVIPFRIGKEDAKAALRRHYSGKPLLPKIFKKENQIEEVKGLYVPFWLFSADVDADIDFDATRVRSWSDSDYNYTETSHYLVSRKGKVGFYGIPIDGSSKMPDILMESIEPFQTRDATDFRTAYLAGFFADKYDVEAGQCVGRAEERIRVSTKDVFASTVTGYSSVTVKRSDVFLKNGSARYALMPVWLLGTNWRGKRYLFAVNGQNGKLAGDDLPVNTARYWAWLLLGTGILTPVAFAVMSLINFLG